MFYYFEVFLWNKVVDLIMWSNIMETKWMWEKGIEWEIIFFWINWGCFIILRYILERRVCFELVLGGSGEFSFLE